MSQHFERGMDLFWLSIRSCKGVIRPNSKWNTNDFVHLLVIISDTIHEKNAKVPENFVDIVQPKFR